MRALIQVLKNSHLNQDGRVVGTTSDIVDTLAAAGTDIQPSRLTKLLQAWGFKQKPKRLKGRATSRRAWVLDDATLARVEDDLAPRKEAA
jgi:hypothetical protein